MFLGTSFAGSPTGVSHTPAYYTPISSFTIKNNVLDEIYATKNVLIDFNWEIPEEWSFDTYLHGLFQNNLYAGNVNYTESVVDKIKIKKRYKGDFTWKTIYEKEINSNEDFSIEIYDYYEPSNRDIEYAYVAVISNVDSDTIANTVRSEFEYYFICDKQESYPMMINTSNEITYNRESATIVSPGRKYPYVVNNGIARYYSGTLNVTFIEVKDCALDVEHGWEYRNRVDEFLANGKPKILKSFEGDIWMVNVVGDLPRTVNDHYQYVSHQIDWVECGNPTLIADLYDNDFIDTDVDRE